MRYANGKPVEITSVVVSTQHTDDVSHQQIRLHHQEDCSQGASQTPPDPQDPVSGQPNGAVCRGWSLKGMPASPEGKSLSTPMAAWDAMAEGAFSGKDPSKVDRSAAYMGRYVAKNVVAAGLASRCEVQFAYAMGYPDPVSVAVDTFGAGIASDEAIAQAVQSVFSFKPADIVKQLNLLRPIYGSTTNYGHFGKVDDPKAITWEKTNKAAALKKALRA